MKPKPITILGGFCPSHIKGRDIAGYEPEPEKKPEQPEPEPERDDE